MFWKYLVVCIAILMLMIGLIGGFVGLFDYLYIKHDASCLFVFHIIMLGVGIGGFILYGHIMSKIDDLERKK